MDGLELAARFSYITNSLHFCGNKEAAPAFLQYLKNKDNAADVQKLLTTFEGLFPYLEGIAKASRKDPFDYEVIEAYWIGNKLLDSCSDQDYKAIIRSLTKRGLPASLAKQRIDSFPAGLKPHHNANVMYVGVGNITKAVETTLPNQDQCRISSGKVVEVTPVHLIVSKQDLSFSNNQYSLLAENSATVSYNPIFLPKITKGDVIAIHWGFGCCILSKKQEKQLQNHTNTLIAVLNRHLLQK